MAGIYPIPIGRSSDALLTRRLMFQLQIRAEAAVACRAAGGHRPTISIGERRRLRGQSSRLTATDTGKQAAAADELVGRPIATWTPPTRRWEAWPTCLANARGLAVQAADSTTSDLERKAMALEIQATVESVAGCGEPAVSRAIPVCRVGIDGATVRGVRQVRGLSRQQHRTPHVRQSGPAARHECARPRVVWCRLGGSPGLGPEPGADRGDAIGRSAQRPRDHQGKFPRFGRSRIRAPSRSPVRKRWGTWRD